VTDRGLTERFIGLATAMDFAVMAVDGRTLGILGASEAAIRILRLEERDLADASTSWLSFMDPETLAGALAFARSSRKDGSANARFTATGTFRDSQSIRITFTPAADFVPPGALAVGLDPDSARQYADRETERALEQEIETSARIQQTLLAGSYTFETAGLSIAAETIPSLKVDGDFYEFYELESGCVDFLVGDVMGKGIPAALTAATLKAALAKAIIKEVVAGDGAVDPKRVLEDAGNRIAPGLVAMGRFITLYYCRVSAAEGYLRFVDAGHTSFLYYDSERDECWQAKGSNMPLGFIPDQRYRSHDLPFRKNDLFLFYSDGITEAESADGTLFSTDRLMQLVSAHSDMSPDELVKKTLSMVFFFTSGGFRDDVTLLALRITEDTPRAIKRFYAPFERESATFLTRCRERFVTDFSAAYPDADPNVATEIAVALIEALGNVIRHTQGEASLDWEFTPRRITVGIDFLGKEYDWFEMKEPVLEEYPDHGFGSWLIAQSVDSILVLRGRRDGNRIVMTRGIA